VYERERSAGKVCKVGTRYVQKCKDTADVALETQKSLQKK
jgi:hypothetical protein